MCCSTIVNWKVYLERLFILAQQSVVLKRVVDLKQVVVRRLLYSHSM